MKRTCSQIDLDERRKIERWRQAGVMAAGSARNLAFCTALTLCGTEISSDIGNAI